MSGRSLPRSARSTTGAAGSAAALLPNESELSPARARLFGAALSLFAARGYHGVSVRDVAAAMGMTPSAIYAHVGSKHDLLAELISIAYSQHRDALRQAMLEAGNDPVEQISALTRAHVRSNAAYPLLARVANRDVGVLEPATQARVLALRAETESLVLDVIERGTRMGSFDPVDPVLAGASLGAMGMRVAEWWDPALGMSVDHLADTYAEFAVRLLTSRNEEPTCP